MIDPKSYEAKIANLEERLAQANELTARAAQERDIAREERDAAGLTVASLKAELNAMKISYTAMGEHVARATAEFGRVTTELRDELSQQRAELTRQRQVNLSLRSEMDERRALDRQAEAEHMASPAGLRAAARIQELETEVLSLARDRERLREVLVDLRRSQAIAEHRRRVIAMMVRVVGTARHDLGDPKRAPEVQRHLFELTTTVLSDQEVDFVDGEPFSLADFFDSKAAWSLSTFGPGDRYAGVVEHIRKELDEITQNPSDLIEWIDVALLAMDGAWRSAGADGAAFVAALLAKQEKNRKRKWPDPASLKHGEVSQHVRDPEEEKTP